MKIVELDSIYFQRGGFSLISNLHWNIKENEQWVLIGPNGSGKSTLASILLGYQWPTSGKVTVLGEDYGQTNLNDVRRYAGIFQPALQTALDQFHPEMTALEVICTGADGKIALYDPYPSKTVRKAAELFEKYRASGVLDFPPQRQYSRLSTGEKRKMLLLRLLMTDYRLLILDEPYESLDIPSRVKMSFILRDIARQKIPMILIVHRLEEIPEYVTHAFLIKKGASLAQGPIDNVLSSASLTELYDIPILLEKKMNQFICLPVPESG